MAAGLGFKTFTTGEVLTAANVNGYLMQGILVFASAAARDSAITSPQEGQACYLKDTNQVLTYSGSAWVAVGGGSPLTTKGDVYGFSTVDARIPIGANNTVLTADSTESLGLKWAAPAGGGGMTLLSTTTLSGATTTISSISGSYKNLQIQVFGATNATAAGVFSVKLFNGGTQLDMDEIGWNADDGTWGSLPNNMIVFGKGTTQYNQLLRTSANNAFTVTINDYASSTAYKTFTVTGFAITTSSSYGSFFSFGGVVSNSVINALTFANAGGNFSSGTVLLYGVS